jgi:hypothetical protein
MRQTLAPFAAFLGLLAAPLVRAQDEGKMPHATPTKEHEALKAFEGEWDTVSKWQHPDGKMHEGRGTETASMMMGDFWLAFVHHSKMTGEKGEKVMVGHGIMGYDPAKGKYTGVWIDSMSPYIMTFEGTADASGKKWTFESSGTDPKTQKACKGKMIEEFKDKDHRVSRFYKMDESGMEKMMGEVQYTRKAGEPKEH